MRLPENTTSGTTTVAVQTIYVLHAEAPVYYPAPDGATYCNSATCTHNHADTREGREETEECAERLARIIEQGRLPKWATLAAPVASDA